MGDDWKVFGTSFVRVEYLYKYMCVDIYSYKKNTKYVLEEEKSPGESTRRENVSRVTVHFPATSTRYLVQSRLYTYVQCMDIVCVMLNLCLHAYPV